MKKFPDEHFLLTTKTARHLYHDVAATMPIVDYHCHLPADQIADDATFENLTQIWLYGDHYKWRAMRANGVKESYITGNKTDREKFDKWAETVPYTLRNPLYHWTHLELQRYFNVEQLLTPASAGAIYEKCSDLLQGPGYSVRPLLKKMDVRLICTTDDPTDSLEHHRKIAADGGEIKVLPAFRPDKAMAVENVAALNDYLTKLEAASDISISSFDEFLDALKQRHDFFSENGCSVSDHGVEHIYSAPYRDAEIRAIFDRVRAKKEIAAEDILKFKSAMLYQFAVWDAEKNWVQQYHVGALRNNNSRLYNNLGADTGADSIGDFSQARSMSAFFDRLDGEGNLAKTIIYNLNPSDNDLMAAMAGNFNDGGVPGKMQFGSAWWFLDQKDGIIAQLNSLSNNGLLSRFVGMLTDSRSFLSFPRHEYFRRILCNLLGDEIEKGELPGDLEWTSEIIRNICFRNAVEYFNWSGILSPAKELG